MTKKIKCSECKSGVDVKPAADYPELRALLEAWHALETSGAALLCPTCAAAVCGDLRGETVEILPFDVNATSAPTTNKNARDNSAGGQGPRA